MFCNKNYQNIKGEEMEIVKPPKNVVRYQSDFCDIPFSKMTASDANLFITICYKYQQELWLYFNKDVMAKAARRYMDENGEEAINKEQLFSYIHQEDIPLIQLGFKEIKKISDYKTGSYKRMAADIRRTNSKLLSLNTMIGLEEGSEDIPTEQFPLFNTFRTFPKEKTLKIAIDRRFARILFDVDSAYTDNEVAEFVRLESIYSKHLYRQLRRWSTGKWYVSLSEFRRLCDVSKSYSYNNMKFKIIEPAVEELRQFFHHLKWEEKKSRKRGNPVTALEFTFDSRPKGGYRKTGLLCPSCGKALFEKNMNGKNCWAHEDGWKEDAQCRKIYSSVAEIKSYSENPQRQKDNENCEIINRQLSKMFDPEEKEK